MVKNRLHFFGTSHTAGGGFEFHTNPKIKKCYGNLGIPNNEHSFSYPGFLERMLDSDYEVFNHAKCGYGNELMYRKIFEVIENPNFDVDVDVLFLEFSDVGRKEFWDNDLKDFVILNYSFDDTQHFGLANKYWYDSKETQLLLNDKKDFYKKYIKNCLEVNTQFELVQRNCVMLVNFLQNNNINFYITNDFPLLKSTKESFTKIKNHLIEYEFPNNKGKLEKSYNFVSLTEPHYHISEETENYYHDTHQGYFVNKNVAKTIYNRLIDDGYLVKLKEKLDYNEWYDIKKKIKDGLTLL